ncbi:hypothetical protein F5148DRAFT_460083 [Russula earlei]|uniref:Uncharacterized protein n=1 Tax=Russula earlei TaxID=71964 RepID=A0ACC0TYC1_9AGAM|nr:hypothetical protein F5148DRAFT_460083 [Russula earlei]
MVDWQNPVTIFHEFGALIKVVHVFDGIYLWEFISNLGFEWSLLQSRRQWRWTIVLYIACRMTTFFDVITELVGMNVTNQINCELWVRFVLFFRYATTSLALSLYCLRGIAIWQRSMPIAVLSAAVVLANAGAWIRRVVEGGSIWSPVAQSCMRVHTHAVFLNNIMLLASEVFLIVLMVAGIYIRNPGPRAFKIMYREGLLWLVLAALVQTPTVVFLALNLNDVMNVIFIAPSVIFTSIGATRMYRTLSDRQAGNLLDFWETSRDETTGEIRFRRQTQFLARTDGQCGDTASTTALPMGRLVRTQPQPEERFVERFEARDIVLDDSESIRDAKPSIATEDDDKSVEGWVHAK